MSDLVTIGIPFYNESKYLSATIESALNQTFSGIQIILCDNCSTDGSYEIAKTYAERDSRIVLYRHEKNEGPVFNFTFAFKKNESPFFVWLGGHDMFAPTYIADALAVFNTYPDTVLAYPGAVSVDVAGNLLDEIRDNYDTSGLSTSSGILKIAQNFNNGYVIHGVFRREVLSQLRFEKVFGPDIAMIFKTATLGTIRQVPGVGFYRRTVRVESAEQAQERHDQIGVFKKNKTNPFALLFVVVSRHVLLASSMSVLTKMDLLLKLRGVWKTRFKLTWKGLIKSFLNKE